MEAHLINKTIPILFIVFLSLISFSYAVKPEAATAFATGYVLDLSTPEYMKVNEKLAVQFHLFNISNGRKISNDTANCTLHMRNSTGQTIYYIEVIGSTHTSYEWGVNDFIANYTGNYGWTIHCNSSMLGGFRSGSFFVTDDGFSPEVTDSSGGITILIMVLILTFGFLIGIPWFVSGHIESPELRWSLEGGSMILGLWLLSLDTAIVATIAEGSNLAVTSELFTFMWIINWFSYCMMFIVFLGFGYQVLLLWFEKQRNKRKGVDLKLDLE